MTGQRFTRPSGGTTTGRQALAGTQINLVTAAAHVALQRSGVELSVSTVKRIVRKFSKALDRKRITFHEFLTNAANLTPQQQCSIMADPDLARVLAYNDPTGERAVNNVMRERR